MWSQLFLLITLALVASSTPQDHNLPVLFQFAQPTHNVAVFRGAALKDAIAKGVVKGFGSLANGRSGKSLNLGSSSGIKHNENRNVGHGQAHSLFKSGGHINVGNTRSGKSLNLGLSFGSARIGKALGSGSSSGFGIGNGVSGVGNNGIGGLSGGYGIGRRLSGGHGVGGGLIGGHGNGVGVHGGQAIRGGNGGGYGYNGGYDEKPDPFHFEYGVHDDKYYTDFHEERSGDEAGNIKGEYTVALPDGRIQDVVYHADGNYGGTIIEVSYKGEARHPDIAHH